jgi:hypothetical protein
MCSASRCKVGEYQALTQLSLFELAAADCGDEVWSKLQLHNLTDANSIHNWHS